MPAVRCWPWGVFSSWLASGDLRYSALQLLDESGACGQSHNRPVSQIRAPSGGLSRTSGKLWQDHSNCYMLWNCGCAVEVWEWISNAENVPFDVIPHFIMDVIIYPCWDKRWTMLVKGAPGRTLVYFTHILEGYYTAIDLPNITDTTLKNKVHNVNPRWTSSTTIMTQGTENAVYIVCEIRCVWYNWKTNGSIPLLIPHNRLLW